MSIGGNKIEFTPLGISSATPTRTRNVSSGILKVQDDACILIDCGEGCQHQIMRSNIKFSHIKMILITHMHGDHVFGLPGLLCTMSNARKKIESQDDSQEVNEVIHIYGPYPLANYLRMSLLSSSTKLGFDYQVHELLPDVDIPESVTPNMDFGVHIYKFGYPHKYYYHHNEVYNPESSDNYISNTNGIWQINKNIIAVPVSHKVANFAYIYTGNKKLGKFMVDKYIAEGGKVGPDIKRFQQDGSITIGNKTLQLEDFREPEVEGKKVVITGDTCDSSRVVPYAQNCDLLIHESTFGADTAEDEAIRKGHSTTKMATDFAISINARKLILTHFSARYVDDDLVGLEKEAQEFFPNTVVAKELESISL
jgi:ribonuclease Z